MKVIVSIAVLVIMLVMAGTATAVVETGWPMDTPNTHAYPHTLVDFDDGIVSKDLLNCSVYGVTFVTMDNHPWIYGCRDDKLNIWSPTRTYGDYIVNGWAGVWCSMGTSGKVVFDNPTGHVSILASVHTGLMMDAYNDSDVKVATSGVASTNTNTKTFDRLSVDRDECDISYVIIHDSGNFWIIDDLLFTTGTVFDIGDAFADDTIPLVVRGADNAGSVDVTLMYNASIVNVTGVSNSDMDSLFTNFGDGWVRIGTYQSNSPGINGTFTLADITFASVCNGTCPIEIVVNVYKDATPPGVSMTYQVNNGTYCSYHNGDVNGDGIVDMFDAMYLAKHVVGMSVFSDIIEQAADVDGSGNIDISDASRLAKCVIGITGYCPLE